MNKLQVSYKKNHSSKYEVKQKNAMNQHSTLYPKTKVFVKYLQASEQNSNMCKNIMLIYYSKHSTRLIKDTLQDLCRSYVPIANEQATRKKHFKLSSLGQAGTPWVKVQQAELTQLPGQTLIL